MKINIYYGGRGLMDDPTLYVLGKIEEVLEELHVIVETFRLQELKNNITTLPQTLKNADGIILATTIEWHGIGGYMQQFLDACWLYGDKEKISEIYMCPIVMSTTYGEQEGKLDLATAWEILGGRPCSGLSGYIADTSVLENNEEYQRIIEKNAENLYRTINQKLPSLPASNQAVKQKISIPRNIDLTPQESEQLSQYVSDDSYVQRQKADIQELTSLFRGLMGSGSNEKENDTEYLNELRTNFHPLAGFAAKYKIVIDEKKKPLIIEVEGAQLNCFYGEGSGFDVEVQMSQDSMNEIVSGANSFQRSFMAGDMKLKGDFKVLRMLDQVFIFA
ncbi:MAG: SCP2 sterol-binding domain-containing protein [Bacillus sp. (in: Bacteria)]|nr:SCP2 sterol-binding domain-containing protein [Bacillus sp. (in: firmicutes)]MCM1427800.1 SCP2 sterol-binding domain-containing protein [Eubacterium sp.]